LPEKGYTFSEELALEFVKSTYGIPTVALSAFVATGVFAGIKFFSFLTSLTLPDLPGLPDLPSVPAAGTVLDNLNVGIVGEEKTKFVSDGLACLAATPKRITVLGQTFVDPLRGAKIATCMIRKGWADDVVLQWLRDL